MPSKTLHPSPSFHFPHRIQRRFMWQQMDNSVMGGLVGRMFNGARAMKSMFGDLLPNPPAQNYGKNVIDFMPTETTRVKYIIRDPHTNKPVKVIKMRGSQKKVVKLMRPLPKPAVTEATLLQYENRMRQLEKEQEMIVEGKRPLSSDEALFDKYFKHKSHPNSNEIVSGKIMEYQSWKPVYKSNEQPTSFVTPRPQPLTQLHTSISASHPSGHYGHHELLPKPEKLVVHRHPPKLEDDEEDDDFEQVEDDNDLHNPLGQHHQYEVTEHTGDASGETQSFAPMEGGFVPSRVYHSAESGQVEQLRQLTPSSNHNPNRSPRPRSRTASGSSEKNYPATTVSPTTEQPNYPAPFLKKYREREAAASNIAPSSSSSSNKSRPKHAHKESLYSREIASEQSPAYNVSFAMSSLRARLQEQHRQRKQQEENAELESEMSLDDVMHGDKWPTEVQHSGSYLTSPIGPSAVAFEQPLKQPQQHQHQQQPQPVPPPRSIEYKRMRKDVRQRGTVKFGDNPSYEEV